MQISPKGFCSPLVESLAPRNSNIEWTLSQLAFLEPLFADLITETCPELDYYDVPPIFLPGLSQTLMRATLKTETKATNIANKELQDPAEAGTSEVAPHMPAMQVTSKEELARKRNVKQAESKIVYYRNEQADGNMLMERLRDSQHKTIALLAPASRTLLWDHRRSGCFNVAKQAYLFTLAAGDLSGLACSTRSSMTGGKNSVTLLGKRMRVLLEASDTAKAKAIQKALVTSDDLQINYPTIVFDSDPQQEGASPKKVEQLMQTLMERRSEMLEDTKDELDHEISFTPVDLGTSINSAQKVLSPGGNASSSYRKLECFGKMNMTAVQAYLARLVWVRCFINGEGFPKRLEESVMELLQMLLGVGGYMAGDKQAAILEKISQSNTGFVHLSSLTGSPKTKCTKDSLLENGFDVRKVTGDNEQAFQMVYTKGWATNHSSILDHMHKAFAPTRVNFIYEVSPAEAATLSYLIQYSDLLSQNLRIDGTRLAIRPPIDEKGEMQTVFLDGSSDGVWDRSDPLLFWVWQNWSSKVIEELWIGPDTQMTREEIEQAIEDGKLNALPEGMTAVPVERTDAGLVPLATFEEWKQDDPSYYKDMIFDNLTEKQQHVLKTTGYSPPPLKDVKLTNLLKGCDNVLELLRSVKQRSLTELPALSQLCDALELRQVYECVTSHLGAGGLHWDFKWHYEHEEESKANVLWADPESGHEHWRLKLRLKRDGGNFKVLLPYLKRWPSGHWNPDEVHGDWIEVDRDNADLLFLVLCVFVLNHPNDL